MAEQFNVITGVKQKKTRTCLRFQLFARKRGENKNNHPLSLLNPLVGIMCQMSSMATVGV